MIRRTKTALKTFQSEPDIIKCLRDLKSSNAAVSLDPSVKRVTLHVGAGGNAAESFWKTSLPSLAFSNAHVTFEVEAKPEEEPRWIVHKGENDASSSPIPAEATETSILLKRTALYDLHVKHKAKLVPFAGWEMPVQYANLGIGASTVHTREKASLFDVSHMLQTRLFGKNRTKFLESLTVADLEGLPVNHSTLSVFTNENGGIIDDTIINKQRDHFYIVSNAGCADKDLAHLEKQLEKAKLKGMDLKLEVIKDQSLLAIQGPLAAPVVEKLSKQDLSKFAFMTTQKLNISGMICHVSRSGYTGEDGFEIQVSSAKAIHLAEALLNEDGVEWAGLGARDSLRLEAGMCLYGHDLDETTSPVEAGLTWTIGKRRRAEGGFLGSKFVMDHLKNGVQRRRIGLIVDGAPAREGAEIRSPEGESVGKITSGCPSPNLKKNIAMAYVKSGFHKAGTKLTVIVRGKEQPAAVVKMPFVESRYHKV